jgi:hypothetical protein
MNSRTLSTIPEVSKLRRSSTTSNRRAANGRSQTPLRHTGLLSRRGSNDTIHETVLKGRLSTFFSHRDPLTTNPPTTVHASGIQPSIELNISLIQEKVLPELPEAPLVFQELPDSPTLGRYEMPATPVEGPKTNGNGYVELMSGELIQGKGSKSSGNCLSWEEMQQKDAAREEGIKRIQALNEFHSVEEIEAAYAEKITALHMDFNFLTRCDLGCTSNCVTCTTKSILHVQLEDLLTMKENDIEYVNLRQISDNYVRSMEGDREMEMKLLGIMRLESRSRLVKTWINAARNDLIQATDAGKKALKECRGLQDERGTDERCQALFEEMLAMVERALDADNTFVEELDDVKMKSRSVEDAKSSASVFKWWANRER